MATTTSVQWERHRLTIHRIYLREDKPLKALMEIMRLEYGFKATKAQYEAKLKFWGMLKNLTPEQWEAVHRRMERRKAANKKTYLILGGRILPEEKIRKATSRYCVGLSMNHMFRAPSPFQEASLPVRLLTPPPLQEVPLSTQPWDSIPLPWQTFRDGVLFHLVSMSPALLDASCQIDIPIPHPNDPSSPSGLNASEKFSGWLSMLRSTMPENLGGDHLAYADALSRASGNSSLALEVFCYNLSNNINPRLLLRMYPTIIRLLKTLGPLASLLRALIQTRSPSARAIVDNLYTLAVHAGDVKVVEILLRCGVDMYQPMSHNINWNPMTPLNAALLRGYWAVAELLLREGFTISAAETKNPRSSIMEYEMEHNSPLYYIAEARMSDLDTAALLRLILPFDRISQPSDFCQGAQEMIYRRCHQSAGGLLERLLDTHAISLDYYLANHALQLSIQLKRHDLIDRVLGKMAHGGLLVGHGALYDAISGGLRDVLVKLLAVAEAPNTERVLKKRMRLLCGAAGLGDVEVAKLLIGGGANHKERKAWCLEHRTTPLMVALDNRETEMALFLLQEDTPLIGGELVLAVYRGLDTVLPLLMDRGLTIQDIYAIPKFSEDDPNNDEDYPRCVLEAAIMAEVPWILDQVLAGPAPTISPRALYAAAKLKNGDLVRRVLEVRGAGGSDDEKTNGTLLGLAVLSDNLSIVQMLLDYGVRYPWCEYDVIWTPEIQDEAFSREGLLRDGKVEVLTLAITTNPGTVPLLLEAGFSVSAESICMAATLGGTALLESLISVSPGVISSEESGSKHNPLRWALEFDNNAAASLLLRAGVQPCNECVAEAIRRGDAEMVKRLLLEKPNLNAGTGYYGNPLIAAASGGKLDFVTLLIQHGADVNYIDGDMRTALKKACGYGYTNVARVLLAAGADADAPGPQPCSSSRCNCYERKTALEEATEHGHLDIVQLLLNAGAKTDGDGRAPYLRAVKGALARGYAAIANVLKEHRARTTEDHDEYERVEHGFKNCPYIGGSSPESFETFEQNFTPEEIGYETGLQPTGMAYGRVVEVDDAEEIEDFSWMEEFVQF